MLKKRKPKKPKFKKGDIVLVNVETYSVPYKMWLGRVLDLANRNYHIELLYPLQGSVIVKIPILFEVLIQKINKTKIATIKRSLSILYFS